MRQYLSYRTIFSKAPIFPTQPLLSKTPKHSHHPFHTTTTMSSTKTPNFSSNYSPSQGVQDLNPLLRENGGRWVLTESGKGVERGFKFKTFKKTWEFMNQIAAECTVQKHHPEWSNLYNTTFIRWTTHSPPGLSEKDVLMARFCDAKAGELGEVEVEIKAKEDVVKGEGKEEAAGDGEGEGKRKEKGNEEDLVDRVLAFGGDCCVPKKKDG